jgi:hypothetical protein
MKHLIPFRIYESQTTSGLTEGQKEFLNKYTRGTWSVNPTTGLVDIDGYFDCSGSKIKNFMGIQFGEVTRSFDCESNLLTSLEGSPRFVRGTFRCNNNSITSLEGSPQTVGGDFLCSKNSLSSIKGAPRKVGEDFWCNDNDIETLEGGPDIVGKDFECENNHLSSLKGSPKTIPGDFYCYGNPLLISLEGAPQTIDGIFFHDKIKMKKGEWNMRGWVEVLNTGSEKDKKLILTLPWLQSDWWNLELQRDPGKTVHLLANVWNLIPKNMQSAIKIPKGYEDDFELFSGFNELGLF